MKPKLLSLLITATLAPAALAHGQDQDPGTAADAADSVAAATRLDAVQVTGSLIPRPQIEGPTPVTTITAEDIQARGFNNVFEALRALPQANGSVQDPQLTGGYTPAAKTISLFGLPPSYTLTLLNGRPMTSYPLAYNGSNNIVDIANIPMHMIERIDVLTGGQSSVYGSSAIAGVVNIVLKDHIEGAHVRVRGGGYTDGGGDSLRLQFSSGAAIGDLDVSYGLDVSRDNPVYAYQRDYIDSYYDSPTGDVDPSRTFLRQNTTTGQTAYIDPGEATCAPLDYLFDGTNRYSTRDAAGTGSYCGSAYNAGYATLANESTNVNGTLFLRYHLTPETEIYSDILASYSNPTYSGGLPFWNQQFYNQTTGQYELWQRIYAPEEVGLHAKDQRVYTRSYNAALGVRGPLGASGFDYDVYFNRSQSEVTRKAIDMLAADGIDAYYLGPQLGTDAAGYPIHAPDPDRLYQPIDAALYDDFTAINRARSISWNQNLTAVVTNTGLFELPAGAVGFAAIVQAGREHFANASQAENAAELFRGNGGGTEARGTRKQQAVGLEFQVPVLERLDANLSARHDDYDYEGGGSSKLTWKAGIEFRPIDTLLLRGSYATAFRAPDMFYLFSDEISGFAGATDYYACRQAGYDSSNYGDCADAGLSIRSVSTGNTDLEPITARTFTYGFVWSAFDNALTWSVDYNSIEIDNEVAILGTDEILATEANCRLGASENGQTLFDIDSPTCQQVLGQVDRRPDGDPVDPNGVREVSSYPINIAHQRQTGIQSSLDYRWSAGAWGDFVVDASYYRVLSHDRQAKEGDPTVDLLCCADSNELRNRTGASLTWNIGDWSSTIYGQRNSSSWNALGTSRTVGPWITWNGSVRWQVHPTISTLLTVNNVFDRRPPTDGDNGGWPYYDTTLYNALGRSVMVEVGFDFE
ncbi:TonB-dependent receptor domain-containing protein [Coralloluteibacterium stylophorae]|uniref:TonB-dependent receptor n=1 Tax=Coralloluteibacterium stylophorae TaxID=1776034 RepID=A0A8J7VRR4_9GAMM|nr:TonB-dependent receptor [Coralloluteibacterium stylophorae]MBS7456902.1 TonB-dependent receptor [Coralloluteibacterium stylophorae]